MKSILDQMEEHIAEIRNLQRNFDFHSKHLEKLMTELSSSYLGGEEDKQTPEQGAVHPFYSPNSSKPFNE